MAGRSKQQIEEAAELELLEPEEEPEQEEAQGEIADEAVAELRSRRTGKARAPRRSDTAPVARPRSSRGAAPGRRAPRQLSLFSREKLSQNVTRTGGSILLSLLAIGCLVVLFYLFAGSRFFRLRGVDVTGNKLLSVDDVEAMVRPNVPRGVFNADLEKIRKDLKDYPLIREAEVGRLLPDRLRVVIVERQPVALARRSDGSVVCVDDEGVMFGDNSLWRGKTPPPLINGLAESGDRASEINRQYVMAYKRLLADLDQTEPPLSSRVDEVYFDEDQGVRLTLADSRVAVLIGNEDFRARLNAALDVLDAVRRRDADALNVLRISDAERLLSGARIAYLNATDPKRVIVGLDE
ncbi:MAG: cell division protein FtsQ/DivIB [Blastocatellia bacterium]